MADCVVCRYWSERLNEARQRRRDKSALKQEDRLTAALQTHQAGACACRFPGLLSDLVMQELKLADWAPDFCDPLRTRFLLETGTTHSERCQPTAVQ